MVSVPEALGALIIAAVVKVESVSIVPKVAREWNLIFVLSKLAREVLFLFVIVVLVGNLCKVAVMRTREVVRALL
jgi:hypothetical protein